MEVQQWFSAVDSDQSGRINAQELSGALVSGQGRHFPESVCELMIGVFSKERNGSIDVYEFQDLYNYMNGCINVFKSYDRDGSGSIDETELGQAMAQMGYRFSPEFYKAIMARYDPTERRKITLDSFVEFSIRLQRATENFRKRDAEQRGSVSLSFDEFIDAVVPIC